MTKQHAKELWDRWQWVVGVLLLPLLLWAAKQYDATNVSSRRFERYTDSLAATIILKEVRAEARDERQERRTKYIICRLDQGPRACSHLLTKDD